MNTIDIFLEAGTALVVAGLILKRRAEEAALEEFLKGLWEP